MDAIRTDAILVRCRLPDGAGLAAAADRFCTTGNQPLYLLRAAWARDGGWCYVYAQLGSPRTMEAPELQALELLWAACCPLAVETDLSRLELVQDLPGHSHGAVPARHYVVETDPEEGWEEELARWYREEHMPGLAAVPGCIHARRFVNHDAGPRSHACYALVAEDVLGCPPWLAVRGTGWSSRVRPHFTNTRRTMMEVAA